MVNTTTIAINNEYYYEFKYVYKDEVVTMRFNADVNFERLLYNFANFVKGCSWLDKTIEKYINTSELDIS